jgi:hypothetical protein
LEVSLRFYITLTLVFLLPASSTQAADKTAIDPTVILQQQVLELQKEVATLKASLTKAVVDQNKQQNYVQIINNELVIDSIKTATIIAADKLTLKSGDASIVLTKYGDILISGEKYDIKKTGDISVKGSKVKSN